ncbi:hypothetical protein H9P43_000559 [Blastocladiella emersonii ATCC 22665]|nr:hypothetical protein H9P43_000559 [Blastocladiella emersonii ATCC 22665]
MSTAAPPLPQPPRSPVAGAPAATPSSSSKRQRDPDAGDAHGGKESSAKRSSIVGAPRPDADPETAPAPSSRSLRGASSSRLSVGKSPAALRAAARRRSTPVKAAAASPAATGANRMSMAFVWPSSPAKPSPLASESGWTWPAAFPSSATAAAAPASSSAPVNPLPVIPGFQVVDGDAVSSSDDEDDDDDDDDDEALAAPPLVPAPPEIPAELPSDPATLEALYRAQMLSESAAIEAQAQLRKFARGTAAATAKPVTPGRPRGWLMRPRSGMPPPPASEPEHPNEPVSAAVDSAYASSADMSLESALHQLEVSQQSIRGLTSMARELQARNAELDAAHRAAAAQLVAAEADLETMRRRATRMADAEKRLRGHVETLESQLRDNDLQLTSASSGAHRLHGETAKLRATNAKLLDEIEEARASLAAAQASADDARKHADAEAASVRRALALAVGERDQCWRKVDELRQENEMLRRKLAKATAAVAAASQPALPPSGGLGEKRRRNRRTRMFIEQQQQQQQQQRQQQQDDTGSNGSDSAPATPAEGNTNPLLVETLQLELRQAKEAAAEMENANKELAQVVAELTDQRDELAELLEQSRVAIEELEFETGTSAAAALDRAGSADRFNDTSLSLSLAAEFMHPAGKVDCATQVSPPASPVVESKRADVVITAAPAVMTAFDPLDLTGTSLDDVAAAQRAGKPLSLAPPPRLKARPILRKSPSMLSTVTIPASVSEEPTSPISFTGGGEGMMLGKSLGDELAAAFPAPPAEEEVSRASLGDELDATAVSVPIVESEGVVVTGPLGDELAATLATPPTTDDAEPAPAVDEVEPAAVSISPSADAVPVAEASPAPVVDAPADKATTLPSPPPVPQQQQEQPAVRQLPASPVLSAAPVGPIDYTLPFYRPQQPLARTKSPARSLSLPSLREMRPSSVYRSSGVTTDSVLRRPSRSPSRSSIRSAARPLSTVDLADKLQDISERGKTLTSRARTASLRSCAAMSCLVERPVTGDSLGVPPSPKFPRETAERILDGLAGMFAPPALPTFEPAPAVADVKSPELDALAVREPSMIGSPILPGQVVVAAPAPTLETVPSTSSQSVTLPTTPNAKTAAATVPQLPKLTPAQEMVARAHAEEAAAAAVATAVRALLAKPDLPAVDSGTAVSPPASLNRPPRVSSIANGPQNTALDADAIVAAHAAMTLAPPRLHARTESAPASSDAPTWSAENAPRTMQQQRAELPHTGSASSTKGLASTPATPVRRTAGSAPASAIKTTPRPAKLWRFGGGGGKSPASGKSPPVARGNSGNGGISRMDGLPRQAGSMSVSPLAAAASRSTTSLAASTMTAESAVRVGSPSSVNLTAYVGPSNLLLPHTSLPVGLTPADSRAVHLPRLFLGTWMLKTNRRDRNPQPRFFWINQTDLRGDITVMWAKRNPFVHSDRPPGSAADWGHGHAAAAVGNGADPAAEGGAGAIVKTLTVMDVVQSNRGTRKVVLHRPAAIDAHSSTTPHAVPAERMDVTTFLVIYTRNRHLHLQAATREDHEAWFLGLSYLLDARRHSMGLRAMGGIPQSAGPTPPPEFNGIKRSGSRAERGLRAVAAAVGVAAVPPTPAPVPAAAPATKSAAGKAKAGKSAAPATATATRATGVAAARAAAAARNQPAPAAPAADSSPRAAAAAKKDEAAAAAASPMMPKWLARRLTKGSSGGSTSTSPSKQHVRSPLAMESMTATSASASVSSELPTPATPSESSLPAANGAPAHAAEEEDEEEEAGATSFATGGALSPHMPASMTSFVDQGSLAPLTSGNSSSTSLAHHHHHRHHRGYSHGSAPAVARPTSGGITATPPGSHASIASSSDVSTASTGGGPGDRRSVAGSSVHSAAGSSDKDKDRGGIYGAARLFSLTTRSFANLKDSLRVTPRGGSGAQQAARERESM